jgi:hypothetical protein
MNGNNGEDLIIKRRKKNKACGVYFIGRNGESNVNNHVNNYVNNDVNDADTSGTSGGSENKKIKKTLK